MEAGRLEQERLESLQDTNQELNHDLESARADLRSLQSQLRRVTADLTARLEAAETSKKDLNRRFLNLNEDCSDIKVALDQAISEKVDALKRCESLSKQSKVERAEADRKAETRLEELRKLKATLADALGDKDVQQELHDRKVGDLERSHADAIKGLREKLVRCQADRNSLQKRLDEEAAKADDASVLAKRHLDDVVKKHLLWIEALKTEVLEKQEEASTARNALAAIKKEREKEQFQLSEVTAELDRAKDEFQVSNKEHRALIQSMEDGQIKSASHVEELNSQLHALQTQHVDAKQQISLADNEISELKTLSQKIEDELETRLEELSSATRKNHDLRAELSQLRADFATAADEQERRESKLEQSCEELSKEREDLQTRITLLEREKVEALDALDACEDLQTRLKATSGEAEAMLKTKEAEISRLREQNNDAAREFSDKLVIAKEAHAKRVLEVETEKEKSVRDAAEECARLKRDMADARQEAMVQVAKEKESVNSIIEQGKEKERQLEERISDLVQENSSLTEKAQQLLSNCETAKKEAASETNTVRVQYETQLLSQETELEALQSTLLEAEKEKKDLQLKLHGAMQETRQLEKEVSDVTKESQQEIAFSTRALQAAEDKLRSSKLEIDALMGAKDKLEKALEAKEAERVELVESINGVAEENKARFEDMHHIIQDRGDAVDSLEQQISDTEQERLQERNALQTTVDNLSIDLGIAKETLSRERDRAAREVANLKKKCKEYQQQIQEADERGRVALSSLQDEVERQRNQIDGIEVERDRIWAQLEAKKREAERISSELAAMKDARATRRLPRRDKLAGCTNLLPLYMSTSDAINSPAVARKIQNRSVDVSIASDRSTAMGDSASLPANNVSPERTLTTSSSSGGADNFAEAANWPAANQRLASRENARYQVEKGENARCRPVEGGRQEDEDDVGTLIDHTTSYLASRRKQTKNSSPHRTVNDLLQQSKGSEIKLPPIRHG